MHVHCSDSHPLRSADLTQVPCLVSLPRWSHPFHGSFLKTVYWRPSEASKVRPLPPQIQVCLHDNSDHVLLEQGAIPVKWQVRNLDIPSVMFSERHISLKAPLLEEGFLICDLRQMASPWTVSWRAHTLSVSWRPQVTQSAGKFDSLTCQLH